MWLCFISHNSEGQESKERSDYIFQQEGITTKTQHEAGFDILIGNNLILLRLTALNKIV